MQRRLLSCAGLGGGGTWGSSVRMRSPRPAAEPLILLRQRRRFGPLVCALLAHRLHPQYLPSGASGGWNSPSAFLMLVGLFLPLPVLMPTLATTKMPRVATARLAAIRPIPSQSTRIGYLGESFPMPR